MSATAEAGVDPTRAPHARHTGDGLRRLAAPLRAIDRHLLAPGSARTLVQVRTALAAVIGLRLAARRWWTMASHPDVLFEPAFAVRWLPGIPPASVLVGLQVVGVVAAVLAIAGRRPRAAFAVSWLALVVLAGLWSSAGKVMHNDVLLLLAAVLFLVARAPGTRSPPDDPAWGWPPRASLAVIATVYAVSGAQKLAHSGVGWVTSDNLRWVLWSGASGTRSPFPDLAAGLADRAWLAHALAAGAVATELAAPILLAFRRTRPVFVVLAAALHVGIWLTLGLDYFGWVLTVAAVALPLSLAPVGTQGPQPPPRDGGPGPMSDTVGP